MAEETTNEELQNSVEVSPQEAPEEQFQEETTNKEEPTPQDFLDNFDWEKINYYYERIKTYKNRFT